MNPSKLALGTLGAASASGGGAYAAYKSGAFSKPSPVLNVEQRLRNEEYELINTDEKYKEIFKELKSKDGFMSELNKHKGEDGDLSGDTDGTKGGPALQRMCSALLKSKEESDFKNASEWCVLRIRDKALTGKSWIDISTGTNSDSDWQNSFNSNKTAMAEYGVEGIQSNTEATAGHPKVKEWCSKNTSLPINKLRKTIFDKASDWCTKTP
ncbi:hypothetical protein HF1_09250 [Mycoplasma haemofelis str. Langford 1]|uniref:Uncharacterized protein n=1 Tax=Mycoplasma haemofelis (strain Langford 1) TaxID=941640 RepID=E8ZIG2_MYCHL|nr:hypothetical protein [Mycoplasma haemofelis]CBY92933.1 hypothetical protein HF1_09250 [Mycoplasma haemofelis str. Langford 1]